MASSSRRPLSNTEAAKASRAQRKLVKTVREEIESIRYELSDLEKKLEISENNNQHLLEINKDFREYIKSMSKIITNTNDRIGFDKDHRNDVYPASDLSLTNILSTNDNRYDNHISTEADVASKTGQKKLKATKLSLNKKLSDLKNKLEISENNNRHLLETKETLKNHIELMEGLVKKRNDADVASDLFSTNNFSWSIIDE
ncbi:12090_t:CDS:2 [Ambispora gerdemannii]|uniref:12090_t:CDS:1 n=1 Tax=Ambispora gerdemannii TaxID=144530 RepID=A0A9N8WJ27_9GLOM|nr:12090_t:CDS:2 [Ambispora gerdemannii]